MKIEYSNRGRVRITETEFKARQYVTLKPVCRCEIEGWAGAAAIGIGVAGSVAGAEISANGQESAAKTTADATKNANTTNYNMFQQGRGSTGSAVLPLYLKNKDGSLFEGSLGNDLVSAYNQTNTPLSTFQSSVNKTAGAQQGAVDLTNNIFNGGVTKEMQANDAPVQAARIASAKSSSLDALHRTLDQIDASQASRGYVGDSYGNRLLSFQAGKSQGDAVGAANLQNLQDTADIKNYGDITLPMQNITLPYNMGQQSANYSFLPNAEYLSSVGQRMQPFDFLKLNAGTFQTQPLPTAPPSGLGAGITSAAGSAGSAALKMFQQQQLQNQFGSQIPQSQNSAIMNEFNGAGSPGMTGSTGMAPDGSNPLLASVADNGGFSANDMSAFGTSGASGF
jgi:hypothetical protein